jgi:exopolyphosphatase / guanosine-5'-triphosphate,3'-diphosphate pyrophosphatase
MVQKNIAIIDLGTNTFHLLIATWTGSGSKVIHQQRIAVKIGVGGINDGVISPAGALRAVEALIKFKEIIDQKEVSTIFAFGTSAFRSARNGMDVAYQIQKETGIEISIISGEEEAGYIYKGVRAAVEMGQETCLIIDIGGGSVEFIIGNGSSVFWKQSFDVGAQRLLERFQKHDPILAVEISDLENYLARALDQLDEPMKKFNPRTLVGSSGTFDTLSEIYSLEHRVPYNEHDPETPLSFESFYKSFAELKSTTREERLQIPGMIEMRVDMIVVACCLIDFILKRYEFDKIRVSTYSLKEGVLTSLMC